MIYIVMGVSGCGKSSIGELLAQRLECPFYDADDYHPQSNIDKMSNGISLNDDDRAPWLSLLANHMVKWEQQGGAVLACSALKQKYRDILASTLADKVSFVYLDGSKALISERLNAREGHFMSSNLLESQFATLEVPVDAINVSIADQPAKIIENILQRI
ncbi:gluconokinase [Catenovulum maritimum]|uniref:Gluconokinase n=1 Tax=Catenovulum maritimum TaxID=1513271 RepID=A0A0J8JH70_9ALTE|nr:gluconokinase [Catenovulum maritimum]KMT63741.1 gluconate kinase [Catenovulum maritimum]